MLQHVSILFFFFLSQENRWGVDEGQLIDMFALLALSISTRR